MLIYLNDLRGERIAECPLTASLCFDLFLEGFTHFLEKAVCPSAVYHPQEIK